MGDIFTRVFSGAKQLAASMLGTISALIAACPVWLVILIAILPYVIALICYMVLWFLDEKSKLSHHKQELEKLKVEQEHELAMLKAKKNTHI